MHRFDSSIQTLLTLIVVILGLGLLVAGLETSTVSADQSQATPESQSVSVVPTPRPASTTDYPFRPLLSIPFAPILPDLTALADANKVERPTNIIAETAASASSDHESPPLPLVEVPEGVINIILLGTDRRPDQGDWRTDTMIVVSINPQTKSVGMLSIPRDLWVEVPGFGVGRINTVDFIGEWKEAEGGGPGLLKRTIEANLGLPVHRYARVDLEGFIQVIDALGGVMIDVDCPIHDAFLDERLTGEQGLAQLDLDVGVHHLDGLAALRYARSRRHGTDFDRAERQQKLLRSLAEQHLNWQLIPKLPRLWQSLNDAVETDLTLPEMVQLASIGVQIQQNRIKSRFIDWRTTENWITASGAKVLLPNHDTLPQAVAEFLNPPEQDVRLTLEHARIEVHNSTTTPGLAEVAAKRLRRQGFEVVNTTPSSKLPHSIVIVYRNKSHTLETLLNVLHLSSDAVIRSPESNKEVDIRVVLGNDWQPCPS